MINLLPPQQKEGLLAQERLRLIVILGTLFILFLLSLALTLLLVENYFLASLEEQKISFKEQEMRASLNKSLEGEITEGNIFLSELNSFYEKQYDLTQTLEKIYQALPRGTYLTKFGFSFVQQRVGQNTTVKMVKITALGFCPTRELLLSLKENLEKEESFSNIRFSPASWVEPIDTDFGVTFNLN